MTVLEVYSLALQGSGIVGPTGTLSHSEGQSEPSLVKESGDRPGKNGSAVAKNE